MDCYDIAKQMIREEVLEDGLLPSKLFGMLTEVDELCLGAGGELRSRQVIATIIMFWRHQGRG